MDRTFLIYLGFLLFTWIVWILLYRRIKKRGKNIKKQLTRISTIQGALVGLVLSLVSQATILVSLFIILLFGFMGYSSISSTYRIRKVLGKKDED